MTNFAEVIGDPIAHSKSPMIHGFWLDALGIEGNYRATRVAPNDLAVHFASRRADPAWVGCNITIPHKVAALDLADRLTIDPRIGAINTMVPRDGALVGTNTDLEGLIACLNAASIKTDGVMLFGAGGAARASLAAVAGLGFRNIWIANRDLAKAKVMAADLQVEAQMLPLGSPLPPVSLVINASALGMTGYPALPFDLAPLPGDALVCDMVYAPLETALLAAAARRGLATVDGIAILIAQAAAAFELFFGRRCPRDRDADLRALLTS